VLEVGIGTDKNKPHYHDGVEVTGVDFNRGMLEKVLKR
jgi:ubiquinone/menaquinone biosynthesis C-methylase UbiE